MSKALFEYTKLNLERTVQGLLTKKSEFIYTDTESAVPIDKTYSINISSCKNELFDINNYYYKYLSDHFGISININI